ncbi:hypothetical protein HYG86_13095 [Alkalicella caledoniensis]|uniref:Sporulation membrane protein YtrI C-terminal domain-containing protein n=1 Tax=Alkalicella caledoniensis TaxID=2731377 RepID=A0A7G9WAD2_ALKCA|nr:hypothetical protein [Alkalicella caledoniensis]QNO15644.1 hypothetical protein HYG86_13095 [Alkalicella caledoniensis]
MKYVYFPFNIKNFPKFVGMFLIGSLIGGSIVLYYHGRNYDTLYVEKKELESYVVELQNTIDRLEKIQEEQHREFAVKEITVETNLSDAIRNVDIKAEVGNLLKDLIGENVEDINSELVLNILDNRIVSVQEKNYRLSVKTLTISKKIQVYLSVTDISGSDDGDQ